MAYKFDPQENVADAIRRTAREQLDGAVGSLREQLDDDPVGAVHSARKAVKKERSLLRLARAAVPAKTRRAENDALRAAARELSAARDAEVMIQTLDGLRDRFAGQAPEAAFAAIRQPLEQERDGARHQLLEAGAAPQAAAALEAVRDRLGSVEIERDGWKAVATGLERSYRRGRAAMQTAHRKGSAEALHDWRKRVKDLWYHERLLAPVSGPAIKGQAKDLDHLADLLGDDHDLAVLRARLTADAAATPVDSDAIIGLIDHRRAELQGEAWHLGERIYAEKPRAFTDRVRRSFKAGRALAAAADQPPAAELAQARR